MRNVPKPKTGDFPAYWETYFAHLPEHNNIHELLTQSNMETIDLVTSVDAETLAYRYAPGKWSIKEIIQHLIDCERVFAYRAMRIARNDKSDNPGFDENLFVANCNADSRNIMDMVREFSILRASTIELFKSIGDNAWEQAGMANGFKVTIAGLAYAIAAHELHHIRVIDDRYLPK